VRYSKDGRACESFISIRALDLFTGQGLFDKLRNILREKELSLDKLLAISTDGANVMMGEEDSLISRLRVNNPNLLSTHCFARRANLIVKDLFKCFPELISLKRNIKELVTYLRTPKRRMIFNNIQKYDNEKIHALLGNTEFRWTSFFFSLDRIINKYEYFLSTLKEIAIKEKDVIAQSFYCYLTKFDTLKNIFILNDLLNIMTTIEKQPQNKNIKFTEVINFVEYAKFKITSYTVYNENTSIRKFIDTLINNDKRIYGVDIVIPNDVYLEVADEYKKKLLKSFKKRFYI